MLTIARGIHTHEHAYTHVHWFLSVTCIHIYTHKPFHRSQGDYQQVFDPLHPREEHLCNPVAAIESMVVPGWSLIYANLTKRE